MYLLIDNNNVVRCIASEPENLHKDKIAAGMEVVEASYGGIAGDKYFPEESRWEKHPENYPAKSQAVINEEKIQGQIRKLAITALQAEGELPKNYKE